MTQKQKIRLLISKLSVGELGVLVMSLGATRSGGEPATVRRVLRALSDKERPTAMEMARARIGQISGRES